VPAAKAVESTAAKSEPVTEAILGSKDVFAKVIDIRKNEDCNSKEETLFETAAGSPTGVPGRRWKDCGFWGNVGETIRFGQ